MRQIRPSGKKTKARYIIPEIDYVTIWVEAKTAKECTVDIVMHFIFEYILTRFTCINILMSARGTHFVNETIEALIEEFQIHHKKSTPYHPQENGTIEAFNNIFENALSPPYHPLPPTSKGCSRGFQQNYRECALTPLSPLITQGSLESIGWDHTL